MSKTGEEASLLIDGLANADLIADPVERKKPWRRWKPLPFWLPNTSRNTLLYSLVSAVLLNDYLRPFKKSCLPK
jgi:hypothetical protein